MSIHSYKIIALLLCFSVPSYGAITRIQSAKNATSGTSVVVTLGSSPSDGNFLLANISTGQTLTGQVTSISQTGATWVRANQVANVTSGAETEVWYAENVSGAGTTITINLGASILVAAIVFEYSGIVTSGSLDQTATNNGVLPSVPDSGTTGTTAQANELWFGGFTHSTTGGTLSSLTNGFTLIDDSTAVGIIRNVTGEKIVGATGTANTSFIYSVAPFLDVWTGTMTTFKAAATVATTDDPMLLLMTGRD